MKITKISQNGLNLIKKYEGFRSKPYLCPAGVPTIGYGNTFYPNGRKVTLKDKPITEAEATELLAFVAGLFAQDVAFLVKSEINQNQFDALVGFAYNLGSDIDADNIPEGLGDSTLLKKINKNPNDKTIKNEFLKWNKADGKVLQGLTKRRIEESSLYFSQ